MLAKDEQILVSGDDEAGFPRNGRSQYLVVVAVPANHKWHRRRPDDGGLVAVRFQKGYVVWIGVEFAAEHASQFV